MRDDSCPSLRIGTTHCRRRRRQQGPHPQPARACSAQRSSAPGYARREPTQGMGVHHQQSVVLRNKTRIALSVSDRLANHACRARDRRGVGGDTDCLSRKSFPLAATRPTLACDWSGGDVRAVGMGHDDASAERSSPVGRLGGSVSRRLFSFNGCADVIAHARARGRGEKVVGRNHEGSWTGGDIPRADTSHFPASRVPDYAAQTSPSLLALNAVLSSVCACPVLARLGCCRDPPNSHRLRSDMRQACSALG